MDDGKKMEKRGGKFHQLVALERHGQFCPLFKSLQTKKLHRLGTGFAIMWVSGRDVENDLRRRKMNVFKRIHDIFGSNVNHALDKLEDPAKMIRYTIVEMEKSLDKAKASTAETKANITSRESELKLQKEAVGRWDVRAQLAVKNGKEELAREAISEKQSAASKVAALETEIAELKNINASQEGQIVKLTDKLNEVKAKERTLVARAEHAKEKIKIERQINSTDCGAAIKRFNEMEEKVERLEAEAAVASKAYESEGKFAEMENNESVESELQALKARLSEGKED